MDKWSPKAQPSYSVLYQPPDTDRFAPKTYPTGVDNWYWNSMPGDRRRSLAEAQITLKACSRLGWKAQIVRTG